MAEKELKLPKGFKAQSAGEGDIKNVLILKNKVSRHYQGVEDYSLAKLRNEWETPGFSPEQSVRLVFSPRGELVGELEVWDLSQPPVHPWLWMDVDPECKEAQTLREYLLSWGEERSCQALEKVDPGVRVSMRISAFHENQEAAELFERKGFDLIRHFFQMRYEMEGRPQDPEWPEGISLRRYDPKKDAEEVYRIDDEVFSDHFGYVEEPFEEGYQRFMHHMTEQKTYDPDLWFLAVEGDEIVGICLCRKWSAEDRNAGYISSLGVRRPWRRRGIALALLRHAFVTFHERGKSKVDLGVDAENLTGAMRLYQEAGMRIHHQYDLYEKEIRPGEEISVTDLNNRS